ncbi:MULTISPECIES: hypothetical protein [unclassified Rhizobium]|uniref:hypothetical protein n=1 Tax=unclassified Rhizobium TaxID=2613769 RepID=UPI001ADC07F6|nr:MULTISPECIES: hypothetical protein [unclassified Rhizobium]MBO9102474.1 hypothetical protein [Rhizobium sp. L58/93]MBO9172502.1 hypothetical protein [Rhizobium sp. L245/93]QXZ88231.1 hypothetical protein J5287_31530 [Rhizobium sp. K1/93]QXZ88245.1 hypothetical protein J5287_30355 [Rhizobium sp. K1/93]QXZ94202.1 hypothetical protein J5280_31065 [Rhizobium sp. K15/93]
MPANVKKAQFLGFINHQGYRFRLPTPFTAAAARHSSQRVREEQRKIVYHVVKLHIFHERSTSDSVSA